MQEKLTPAERHARAMYGIHGSAITEDMCPYHDDGANRAFWFAEVRTAAKRAGDYETCERLHPCNRRS